MLALMALPAGCQQVTAWRDAQISKSRQAAQSPTVAAPAQPVVVPQAVLDSLPLDPSMTLVSYSKTAGGDEVAVSGVAAWSVTDTCNWMLAWMQQAGYQCDDNPSRILEGLEFSSTGQQSYTSIRLQVTLNTAEQCLFNMTARK